MKFRSTLLRNVSITCVFAFVCLQYYLIYHARCDAELHESLAASKFRVDIKDNSSVLYNINKIENFPMVFIGGYARSGTTLMRAILDVHPSVICGPETKVLPQILKFYLEYKTSQKNIPEILNSGLTQQKLDNAMRLFIYYIMNEHIRPAERLCAKDPNILYYIEYLHKLYPNAKFIWLVRDPRAVVFSLLGLYREGLNMANAKKYFITWQQYNKKVKRDCDSVGSSRCIMVKYEDLILAPKETIGKVASFLNLEWTDDFLRHEEFIDNGKTKVSDIEWSSHQIKKAIYKDALTSWVGKIKYDEPLIKAKATLIGELGYGEKSFLSQNHPK